MVNPKDEIAKVVTAFHDAVFTATKGKVFGNILGMPVVKLTTTGRRSGKKRSTMLTTPLVEGETVVLVASWGGDDRHPTWYLNLRDDPDVEITMDGRTRRMKATVASAERRAELWPKITSRYKNYAEYQTKTDREIPVIELTPA